MSRNKFKQIENMNVNKLKLISAVQSQINPLLKNMFENQETDVEEAAANACALLLPEKSKERYHFIYSKFKQCQEVKHLNVVDEKALLAYFFERSQRLKSPASLWSEYSMLKTTLSINDSIDISKFPKLRAFLKRRNDGYKPKKSNVFSRQEMKKFFKEAPDNQYLLMKVVALIGIAGACRKEELLNMTLRDVEDKRDVIIINIPDIVHIL